MFGAFVLFSFCMSFFLRTVIGAFQEQVMTDLTLTSFEFSLLSTTLFLLIYGLMQLPVGIIVDNIGLKPALLIGSLCCTLSSIGFSYSDTFAFAMMNRMLMGFGASFGFICLLIAVHEWMPRRYIAIFIGISQFIGTLGPMAAAGPLDSLSESSNITWQFMFLSLGFVGAAITALIFFFVENNLEKAGSYSILHRPEPILVSLRRLFGKVQPWLIAVSSACLYFAIEYLSENEGRTFMMLKGFSLNTSSYMLTISWIGFAIACPLIGFLSDMLERRKAFLGICAIIGLIAISIIVYSTDKQYLQIAFFMLGISASGQCICFAMIAEHFKKQFVAIGFGLNNAMIMVISAINAPAIGLTLDQLHQGDASSHEIYQFVFGLLIIIGAVGVFINVFLIKETFCKSTTDFTVLKPTPSKALSADSTATNA